MAFDSWLGRVKTALSNGKNPKSKRVAVLSFEVAGVMSRLLHLYQSLSDAAVVRLRNDAVSLEGALKLVSNDESFLLRLARAELAESVRVAAGSVSRLSCMCHDPFLRSFHRVFTEFANSGYDPHAWTLTNPKEIEAKHKKLERYVSLTSTLHREMEELSVLESALRKALNHSSNNNNGEPEPCSVNSKDHQKLCDLQQKIFWQKQEVKELKEKSLWNKGFDGVVLLLVRFLFTVLARIKVVFGIGHCVPYLSRSLSASATVFPSDQNPNSENYAIHVSRPFKSLKLDGNGDLGCGGFFESNCKLLKPMNGTLGASALAFHYANLIIVMEKMIKSPQLVGVEARDDLYAMLPSSIRSSLRSRLKGVGFSACDPVLAGEWREALGRILGWISPLAHNMIRWQSERSFEQMNLMVPKTNSNVLLLQTLFFADKEKTEAAITELLVGLNYIWRFEREMTAKAFFEGCNNSFNGLLNVNHSETHLRT
ncbi:protein PSK SIMULATOR 3 [Arachis stenosperma]|uniref:protein PSK SIMULATOR 3 n=1 Tax=Arachis stenosperma TaxID=217475 RepID=UPI0025AC0DEE|nr:protein PSK SIMULATOR 3 [Arachis stenosperma]